MKKDQSSQHNTIEKIYVCKTNEEDPDLIEKILVQYSNGSYSHYTLPPCYHKKNLRKQRKLRKKLENSLSSFIKELTKQEYSNLNDLENSNIIIVTKEDKELAEYIDDIIESENKRINENGNIGMGIFSILFSIIFLYLGKIVFLPTDIILDTWKAFVINETGFFMDHFISCGYFLSVIHSNRNRKLSPSESKIGKKLKLYFSYLMLIFNIGLNIENLSVNYEKFQRLPYVINLEKKRIIQNQILNNLDNPFSDSDNLTATTDEKVDILMEAIQNNYLIDKEDIEIALNLEEYLKENPYNDYEKLYENFSSTIIISDPLRDTVTGDNKILAERYKDSNIIMMYFNRNASEDNYKIRLLHELIHSTGHLENVVLNEGITTILQAEYTNNFCITNAYYDHVLLTKIFCELITPEKMLEAYSKEDMSIIKEEMLKLNPNEENYINLMNTMQKYADDFHKGVNDDFKEKYKDIQIQFFYLLIPYLESDYVTEDQKVTIINYIGYLGKHKDVCEKIYFNKEDTTMGYQYTMKWNIDNF